MSCVQLTGCALVPALAANLLCCDQSGALQHFKMFGHTLVGNIEPFSQLSDGKRYSAKPSSLISAGIL